MKIYLTDVNQCDVKFLKITQLNGQINKYLEETESRIVLILSSWLISNEQEVIIDEL